MHWKTVKRWSQPQNINKLGSLSECVSNRVPWQSVLGFGVFSNDLDGEKKFHKDC